MTLSGFSMLTESQLDWATSPALPVRQVVFTQDLPHTQRTDVCLLYTSRCV